MKALSRLAPIVLLAGCASIPEPAPADRFFAALSSLCGRAFAGRVTSPDSEADRAFAAERLIMHVRDCGPDRIRIPFHVGEDRSRTWVVERRGDRLRLGHDHRHEDGSEDRLSNYGGVTASPGTGERQEFPADAFSQSLFERENIPQSSANVWAMEVHPDRMFAYELRRPGRFFRAEFDLARPVPLPSAGR